MSDKTTTARRLTDEQAIRIGVADILVTLSSGEVAPEQKSMARSLIEQAVKILKQEIPVTA